jgi:phage tail-like protein
MLSGPGAFAPVGGALVPVGAAASPEPPGTQSPARWMGTDLTWIVQVVTARLPVRSAKTFLQRAVGNPVDVRLVELGRGEKSGVVREVEIHHVVSGERTTLRAQRLLASGEPASFFVPDHLVRMAPHVEGPAARTGVVHAQDRIVLVVPVRGYLRYLPAIFGGDGPVALRRVERTVSNQLQAVGGAARLGGPRPDEVAHDESVDGDPLRRFLFLFQHLMTTVTDTIDGLERLTDPVFCDAKFLPWLASWVGFELDESLPIHQQRELVRRAIRLYRSRGTRVGIEEMVEVLTSAPVRVRERARPHPMVLGRAHLVGGEDAVGRYLRAEEQGGYLLEQTDHADTDFFVLLLEARDAFAERFGERATHVLRRIADVVSHERPAHVAFTLRFDESP